VSFAQELKDFSKGFAAGSEIRYRRAAAKNIEMNLPILGPGDLDKVPGTFQPGGGGGVGETSAPRVTGGSDDTGGGGGKRPRPRSLQEAYRQGIANIESGGGNYNAVGKQTGSGDRAYGKYQIMGANIPVWTKQWLGRSLTPEQFLKSPEAQDWVFDRVFGGYVKKYGLQGAARAWFGGEGAVNDPNRTDIHGKLTTGSYGRQFAAYVTNLGDLPDVSDEEMAEVRSRIDPRAVWDDTGYYPEGKPADAPPAGSWRADQQEEQQAEEPAPTGEETTGAIAESPEITAPQVDLTPQVQEAPQVGDEEEEHYAMGGVIPDDEQRFQMGGTPDPYNPNRAYTQMGSTGYTPPAQARRITLPGAGQTGTGTNSAGQNWRDWGAGGSPTQVKLRDARAQYAAAEKAKADAAAKAAADAAAAAAAAKKTQSSPYVWSAYRGGPQGKETFQTFGDFFNTLKTGKAPPRFSSGSERYGSHAAGGMVGYARGGTVAKKPKSKTTTSNIDWAEANRRAGKPSFEDTMRKYSRVGSSQRGDQAQEVRDRAAREMNARAGRPSSSAWADTSYVRPAPAPTPQQTAPGQVRPAPPVRRPAAPAPTPTPRPPVSGGEPGKGRLFPTPIESLKPPGGPPAAPATIPPAAPPAVTTPNQNAQGQSIDPNTGQPIVTPRDFTIPPAPKIEVQPEDPNRQPVVTPRGVYAEGGAVGYARGGVIPDDDRPRSDRAESAGYQTPRRKKPRTDPWAGLRTKSSQKVRKPSTSTVKRGAAKRKKKGTSQPGRERRQGLPKKGPIPPERPQALPERGPIPPARPERSGSVPPGTAPPIRDPGGLMQPIGTLGPAREPFRPADTQGASPFPPPNASVPMPQRPQQGPPAPIRPGNYGPSLTPSSPGMQVFQGRPDLAEAQAVRGGPASPPVDQSVRPARPADYGPALTPASRGMQVFQGEEAPGEPIPERFARGSEAEPLPERFGREAEPLPERFGREPVQGGLPPEYYYEEEPAFAKGGVIPDDTDGPFRQRAGRRGGLQLRLPTKSYAKGRR